LSKIRVVSGLHPLSRLLREGLQTAHLAIRPFKQHALRSESVEVRCLHVRRPVAAELGPQIVDGDEERR